MPLQPLCQLAIPLLPLLALLTRRLKPGPEVAQVRDVPVVVGLERAQLGVEGSHAVGGGVRPGGSQYSLAVAEEGQPGGVLRLQLLDGGEESVWSLVVGQRGRQAALAWRC